MPSLYPHDLTSEIIGSWLVIEKAAPKEYFSKLVGKVLYKPTYLCRCECGEEHVVLRESLVSRKSTKCKKCRVTQWSKRGAEVRKIRPRKDKVVYLRTVPEYIEWRISVYSRDNYTCVACGDSKAKLNAHHIMSHSKFPELRYLTVNGVTLCVNCHKSFHRTYGTKGNTLSQFLGWCALKGATV